MAVRDVGYNTTFDSTNASYRTDVVRIGNYDDLIKQVIVTFNTYSEIDRHVSPAIARNSNNEMFILTKEWIHSKVNNSFGMNSFMYQRLIDAIEKFYFKNRLTNRLPSPHIICHRSVHYGEGLFEIKEVDLKTYLGKTIHRIRNFAVKTVHQLNIDGLEPIYIENMKFANYKYLILRPKLGKTGTPSVDRWEILLYKSNLGYNVTHIDTDKNPRYNGKI